MSDELARLRADLEAMKRIEGLWAFGHAFSNEFYEQQGKIRDKIARLEAEAADPWRGVATIIRSWATSTSDPTRQEVAKYIDHLTAERDRLAARVAELEGELSPIDPDGYQLGDFRVMKTAQEIARYAMDRNMDHPVTVETARRAIWAIKEFVEQARHWHGLSKLKPYRWTSLGHDDTNFIDEDFDATESPCDCDPDAHKPLGDMHPPFEGPIVGLEPILDPARVLATAVDLLHQLGGHWQAADARGVWKQSHLTFSAKPYRLKGGSE